MFSAPPSIIRCPQSLVFRISSAEARGSSSSVDFALDSSRDRISVGGPGYGVVLTLTSRCSTAISGADPEEPCGRVPKTEFRELRRHFQLACSLSKPNTGFWISYLILSDHRPSEFGVYVCACVCMCVCVCVCVCVCAHARTCTYACLGSGYKQ